MINTVENSPFSENLLLKIHLTKRHNFGFIKNNESHVDFLRAINKICQVRVHLDISYTGIYTDNIPVLIKTPFHTLVGVCYNAS